MRVHEIGSKTANQPPRYCRGVGIPNGATGDVKLPVSAKAPAHRVGHASGDERSVEVRVPGVSCRKDGYRVPSGGECTRQRQTVTIGSACYMRVFIDHKDSHSGLSLRLQPHAVAGLSACRCTSELAYLPSARTGETAPSASR